LIPYIENPASKCTFISSTSVYGDNDNVTEETDLKPESEGGRQLVYSGEAITNEQSF
jgi:hypothetical protein